MNSTTYLPIVKKLAGPVLGLLAWWLLSRTGEPQILCQTAGIAIWMAVWWMTEAINIYFTAFIPVFAFPLFGIIPMKEIAPAYLPSIIFLFIGGFFLAFALERWNLHKRIALAIILKVGASPNRILFGFMLASYFLSMWILNTATVMMMMPALLAVVDQMEGDLSKAKKATPFLLGLAFASSIGGTATIIGTAPNLYFMEFYNENFVNQSDITFGSWFLFGFPVSLLFFFLCFGVLRLIFNKDLQKVETNLDRCKSDYQNLGPVSYEEKSIGILFLITVLLWFTNRDLVVGSFHFKGWARLLPESGYVNESTVAMFMAFLLMLIPSRKEKGTALLRWQDAKKMPLGIIFLFGGGFALAKGITTSGLSGWLGDHLIVEGNISPILLVFSLCIFMTFFTELVSNTASTVLILPLLAVLTASIPIHPYLLLMPVVFSASMAFMLPVATPPNTIVFGSDRLSIRDMVRTGIWLNLAGAILLTSMVFSLGQWLYDL